MSSQNVVVTNATRPYKQRQILPRPPNEAEGTFWGLDIMDRIKDGKYNYDYTGKGVNVYILDSGLVSTHPGFKKKNAKVIWSYDSNPVDGDCNGHGSHVAGIVGGDVVGIAKRANIHMLRISDCNSTFDNGHILNALNFLKTNIQKPAVLNFSFGAKNETTESDAASNESMNDILSYFLDKLEIPIIISAGNSKSNKCDPIFSNEKLIVVGATSSEFKVADFSNYGPCVNFYAPGAKILSHSNMKTKEMYQTFSGTSQSAPFVAGVSALLMEIVAKQISPTSLHKYLSFVSINQVPVGNIKYPFVYAPVTARTLEFAKAEERQRELEHSQLTLIIIISLSIALPLLLLSIIASILAMRKGKKKKPVRRS
ncbi:hypothetical protein HMI54_012903 [Coelomomyces lativittatus]|nr:hypothetical protein HMI56_005553 [Coelomomyces lativittatus]KAJ1513750.1 hypothetical protein HMI55_005263 [Coelomomyces lativittatus]KAJ1515104.1 hypothetical protein HMI54_012903 [Coelomomyces lativittatus]